MVLARLGGSTHSNQMDQRHVVLQILVCATTIRSAARYNVSTCPVAGAHRRAMAWLADMPLPGIYRMQSLSNKAVLTANCAHALQASSNSALSILAPPDSTVAPPGYYMLFLVSAAGVPSVATFVLVTGAAPPTDSLVSGQSLAQLGTLYSANNQFFLQLAADGGLTVSSAWKSLQFGAGSAAAIVYSFGTNGTTAGPFKFVMQPVSSAASPCLEVSLPGINHWTCTGSGTHACS